MWLQVVTSDYSGFMLAKVVLCGQEWYYAVKSGQQCFYVVKSGFMWLKVVLPFPVFPQRSPESFDIGTSISEN